MAHTEYVCVIGGANIDIAGQASGALVTKDSNIGTVRLSHGGVGRNIAHNLALLGCDVHLIAPFGDDALADELTRGCLDAGIHLEHSFVVPGATQSSYLFVMDHDGEMQLAINDMSIIDELSIERLEERLELICGAAACVIDANLDPAVLSWAADAITAPIFSDPISCAKAPRLKGIVGNIHSLKPNRLEAEALTGTANMDQAADLLLATGLERAFISLGRDGLLCADTKERIYLPCPNSHPVNATGAGDAMTAALVWSYLKGATLKEAGKAGLAASAITVESEQTVSPSMTEAYLYERIKEQQ